MKLKYPTLAEADCFVDGDNGSYRIYENPAKRVFMEKKSEGAGAHAKDHLVQRAFDLQIKAEEAAEKGDLEASKKLGEQIEKLCKAHPHVREAMEGLGEYLFTPTEHDEASVKAAADNQVIEALSEVFHDAWMHWSKSVAGEIKDPERVARWQTFWVPYEQLDESTKDLDREWAVDAYKLIEPLIQPDKMAKEMVTRVVEKHVEADVDSKQDESWLEDLALTLLGEAVSSVLDYEETEKEFPENYEIMRDTIIRSQEDVIENLKDVIDTQDFGGKDFLPLGLAREMHQDFDKVMAGKATLHQLYDEYPTGAHRLILNMLGHGVFLDDDKEGVDWMKAHGITRDDMDKLDDFESPHNEAFAFLSAWNQYLEGQS